MKYRGYCKHPKNVFQFCDENFCPRKPSMFPCNYRRVKPIVGKNSMEKQAIGIKKHLFIVTNFMPVLHELANNVKNSF